MNNDYQSSENTEEFSGNIYPSIVYNMKYDFQFSIYLSYLQPYVGQQGDDSNTISFKVHFSQLDMNKYLFERKVQISIQIH